MQTCIELKDLPFGVKVEQLANRLFRVTYGKQEQHELTYAQAAHEFGECVFHALSCANRLENTSKKCMLMTAAAYEHH